MMKKLLIGIIVLILIILSSIIVIAPYWYGTEAYLISHWTCDGDFTDRMGANDGEQSGGVKIGPGVKGRGCVFDGLDDRIYSSNFDVGNVSNITMAGWVKMKESTVTVTQSMMYKRNIVFELFVDTSSQLQVWMSNDAYWHNAGVSPAYNDWDEWHHIAATYNGSKVIIYRDGVQVETDETESGNMNASNNEARIGYSSSGAYFNGSMDDIRIYNKTLSPAEILELYNSSKTYHLEMYTTPTLGLINETPEPVLTDESGLFGYWKFNNDALDSSGQGNDGILNGGILNTTGRWNEAYNFLGRSNSDTITLPTSNFNTTDSFSVSVWFKYRDRGPKNRVYHTIISRNPGGSGYQDNMNIWINNNTQNIQVRVGNTTNTFTVSGVNNLNDGLWHHALLTYNQSSNTTTLYEDGVSLGSAAPNKMHQLSVSQSLIVGEWAVYNNWFNGTIDEIRIYNRTLLPAEVTELYLTKGLVGHWTFDTKDGSNSLIAPDVSLYNNSGTIAGTGVAFTNEGRFKEAYNWDGTIGFSNCIVLDDSVGNFTKNFSITSWFKINTGAVNVRPAISRRIAKYIYR
jgi:hypothetical protein